MAVRCFEQLLELTQAARQADILTVIEAPSGYESQVGAMLVLPVDDQSQGLVQDEGLTSRIIDYIQASQWKQPMLIEIDYHGSYRLFWDKITAQPQALVLGAGHISQPLVELLALVGYETTVVDDRPDFANKARFPQATSVRCQHFAAALAELNLAAYQAVIIVTRGHRYDMECLRTVLNHHTPYMGMIGSQRRVKGIIEMLADEGVSAGALARLRAPIGLDIGAQTPAEIALSIVAEIMAVTRGADCLPLSGKRR